MRRSASAQAQEAKAEEAPAPEPQELSEITCDGGPAVLRIVRDGKRACLEVAVPGTVRLSVVSARMLRSEIERFLQAAGAKV